MSNQRSSNDIKSDLLGMSFGKANGMLRKKIIFEFAKRLGMDNCYQCGEAIGDIDNLSIEHKRSWQKSNEPVELFFDIENIAFSHTKCNCLASDRTGTRCARKTSSKSGFKGVYVYENRPKKYRAFVGLIGKGSKSLGYYETAIEAAMAYDEAALKEYGDKAVTNKSLGLL